jgi:sec-independent protein translocase protein TatC
VGVLILAALLTPPDIVSQVMLALPTYALFELGLFFARRTKKPKPAQEETETPAQ